MTSRNITLNNLNESICYINVKINPNNPNNPINIPNNINNNEYEDNDEIFNINDINDNYFLSVHEHDNLVDMYHIDDNSGRQKWIIGDDYIELYSGRHDNSKYLGIYDDKFYLFYKKCKYTKCTLLEDIKSYNDVNIDSEILISNIKYIVYERQRNIVVNTFDNKYNKHHKHHKNVRELRINDFKFDIIPFNVPQNIIISEYYLSTHIYKNIVDLFYMDDNSGRQKWIIELNNDTENKADKEYIMNEFYIKLVGGRSDFRKYLGYSIFNETFLLYNNKENNLWTINSEGNVLLKNMHNINNINNINNIDNMHNIMHNNVSNTKIAILLRGHVRNGFDNSMIKDYIIELQNLYNIDLFIHTWDVKEANRSWRKLTIPKEIISKKTITNYFGNIINPNNIIIDSDVNLRPKLTGTIRHKNWKTSLPLISWKYMWWGINRGLEMINGYDIIINTRLDIFTLPYNNLDFNNREKYLNMVEECILNNCDIKFMYKQNNIGIDNYYLGK